MLNIKITSKCQITCRQRAFEQGARGMDTRLIRLSLSLFTFIVCSSALFIVCSPPVLEWGSHSCLPITIARVIVSQCDSFINVCWLTTSHLAHRGILILRSELTLFSNMAAAYQSSDRCSC